MPTLKELAQLGKQALLAFVAQLLTELAALNARVEELRTENATLRTQLDQLARDAKRQAAPFSKGKRKARPGTLPLPHPAAPRPMDRSTDRSPIARSGLSLLRRAVAGASGRFRRDHRPAPAAQAPRAALSRLGLSLPDL